MKWGFIATLMMILLSYRSLALENDWGKMHKKEGITCRYRNVENSDYKEFRAEVVLNSNLNTVVAVLRDTKNWHKWSYCGKKAELLKIEGNDVYQYIETEIPWPFPNRDLVYHCKYLQDSNNYNVRVDIEGLPDYVPEKKNIVRVQYTKGHWELIPLSENKVKVVFQMHIESGGNVPAWFANVASSESPFETLKNLRERVKLKQYHQQKFDFITERYP